jgi:mRNA interferase MazF
MKQRELLLVPFPFSDQSGKKVSPVIVISNDNFNEHSEDVIVVGVTSSLQKDCIYLNNNDLEEGK